MIRNSIILLLTLAVLTQCSRVRVPRMLSPEQQKQDFDLMAGLLTEACPVLHVYRSRAEVDNHLNAIRQQLGDSATVADFYLCIQRTLSFFHDGHLQAYAGNDYYAMINNREAFLPLQLRILNGKIYLWENLTSNEQLQKGLEITSVNGVTSSRLISDINEFISADANNLFFKQHKLNNEYRLYLAFYFDFPSQYQLQIEGVGGITVQALSAHDRSTLIDQKVSPPEKKELYSISYDEERSMATFQFTTFGDQEGAQELRKILDDLIKQCEVRDITDLVLDIRGNTGGFDGNAAIVYSYLSDVPFRPLIGRYLRVRQIPYLEHVLNKDMQEVLESVPVIPYEEEYQLDMALDQVSPPNPLSFSGRVYLLTDHSTFSTASLFTSIFRNNERGLILGSPTGGGAKGDSGGIIYLELPHSGINVFVPLVRNEYFNGDSLKMTTLAPDIEVEETIENLLSQKDPLTETLLRIITEAQTN